MLFPISNRMVARHAYEMRCFATMWPPTTEPRYAWHLSERLNGWGASWTILPRPGIVMYTVIYHPSWIIGATKLDEESQRWQIDTEI